MRRLVCPRHSKLPAVRSVAFAALALLVAATGAGATVRIADSNATTDTTLTPPIYAGIQEAVDASDPGDVIIVRPAAGYDECVDLNVAGLVVVAAGGVFVHDDGCEYVVKITADNVRFQGFYIDGDSCGSCGGIKTSANGAQILTNTILDDGIGEGIHVGNSGAAPEIKLTILSNNTIDRCGGVGIYLDTRSKQSQLFGNAVRGCDDDLLRVLARDNVITSNSFIGSNNADGIDIDAAGSNNNKFTSNVSANNYDRDFEQITGVSGTKLTGNVFPNSCTNCDSD